MGPKLIWTLIFETFLGAAALLALWHEEQLIDFEERVVDWVKDFFKAVELILMARTEVKTK